VAKNAEDTSAIIRESRRTIAIAFRLIGHVRLKEGNSHDAIELFLRSIHYEDGPDAHSGLQAAYSMENGVSAAASHKASDSVRPSMRAKLGNDTEQKLAGILAGALNDLGTTEARQQSYSLALEHFQEAEKWAPTTPELMRNIGLTAMQLGKYPEVVRALRPALAARPDDRVVRSILGSALFSTNAFADAAGVLAPLGDSLLQQPELAYTQATALVRINKYPEATALLEKLEMRPLSTEMIMLVAQTWSQMGNYLQTIELCQRAVQADPKLLGAHQLAGLALIRLDRAADAAQEFRSELSLDPTNTDSQFHLAFVLLQQSHNEEATEWLGKVLSTKPEHAEANYELGKELLRNGRSADAIPYLETASRLKPKLEAVHYQLQSAYRAVGRKEEADREATIYRELKAKSRNIKLPPPPAESAEQGKVPSAQTTEPGNPK